ncbi:MAG: hypothetical protein EA379_08640 [Phycisphaerales bacterium]|nr:MAG: hypothetical protein EA379_08640 [Phycisphaerales bacterium]
MTTEIPASLPRLAPPGAGIPAIERIIGGAIFSLRRWRGSREAFSEEFKRERESIAQLCRGHGERTLSTRVLVPRLRGLEDSSRHWSVYMTIDHLRIVNEQIAIVIESLARGLVPEGQASIADVKPRPDIGPTVAPEYEVACDRLLEMTATSGDLRTPVRYAHPWFGPLDALGWHSMASAHMGIHRAQIARILATGSKA